MDDGRVGVPGGARIDRVDSAGLPVVAPAVNVRVHRQLFDRESLAEYLRLSPDTVDRLVKAGKLPRVRIGHQVRFTLEDVDGFIERHRGLGPAA
jgi:excisionase family DNA binding protein